VNCESDAAAFFEELLDGSDIETMITNIQTKLFPENQGGVLHGSHALFGQFDLDFNLSLEPLLGKLGKGACLHGSTVSELSPQITEKMVSCELFSLKGAASAMIKLDWEFSPTTGLAGTLGVWAGASMQVNPMQFLGANPAFAAFGMLLDKSLNLQAEITAQMFMAMSIPLNYAFGITFEAKAKMDCAPVKALGDGLYHIAQGTANVGGPAIYDAVYGPIKPTVDALCGSSHEIAIRFSLGWKGTAVDRKNTYVELITKSTGTNSQGISTTTTTGSHRLTMEALPTCAPGGLVGDSCSLNTDCYSTNADTDYDGYGGDGKGYCKNSVFDTSVLCLGTCMKKLSAGASCSADTLNIPVWQNNAASSEKEACESGSCICDSCTKPGTTRLPDGDKCATDDNCLENSFCKDKRTVIGGGCVGTCQSKKGLGISCHYDNDCVSGKCDNTFGGLGQAGTCVECWDHGHCPSPAGRRRRVSAQFCDGNTCKAKLADGVGSNNDGGRCQSGITVCGTCGKNSQNQPCSEDWDCHHGDCTSHWWQSKWGCNGWCQY
jgi:hypothetical protein